MHLQCTMSSIFDLEVRRLGMRDTLKHETITVSGYRYFHKNCRFLWGKNVSKTNLGRTIHYTYMSYDKYFRCGSLKSVSSDIIMGMITIAFTSILTGWMQPTFLKELSLIGENMKKQIISLINYQFQFRLR